MRASFACVLVAVCTTSCGLVLDFDPEDRRDRDGGTMLPELDGNVADMRRDARRDGRPDGDGDVSDEGVEGDAEPIDMGPIDPDAGCGCAPETSRACVDDRCVCGAEDACDGSRICCDAEGSLASCVDPKQDDLNCGACGLVCGANARCEDGACVCDDRFQDCDGEPGCEADVENDPGNCGACGLACDPAAGPSCVRGECVSCESDGDCGGSLLHCLSPSTCDTSSGLCVPGDIVPDTCLVDGECFDRDDASPTTSCLVCAPEVDPFAFTPAEGRACDDGRNCTDGDECDPTGACLGQPQACDDFVSCTADFCDVDTTGECQHAAMPGFCLDPADPGMCLLDGTPVGRGSCMQCDGDSGGVVPSPVGASCDDGDRCNGAESCDGTGRCTSGPPPPPCDASGLPLCFEPVCNPTNGMCGRLRPSSCFIEGACRPMGPNPDNPCQRCDPATSTTAWTNSAPGASCRVNAVCRTGVCTAGGMCMLNSASCTTLLHESCNPVTGSCTCLPGFVSCGASAGDANGCECLVGGCSESMCALFPDGGVSDAGASSDGGVMTDG